MIYTSIDFRERVKTLDGGILLDPLKDIRWRQRFENFEKSYKLLVKYSGQEIKTELEREGMIQFFSIRCREVEPEFVDMGKNHFVACHFV